VGEALISANLIEWVSKSWVPPNSSDLKLVHIAVVIAIFGILYEIIDALKGQPLDKTSPIVYLILSSVVYGRHKSFWTKNLATI